MAFVTPDTTRDSYDVIVVGSGAGGGQTAYTLTMEGAKVLMLEAGRNYDPAKETPMFQTLKAPLRGAGTPDKPFGFHDATIDGGWEVPGEPYTNASPNPKRQFKWWRARMLGGRTNHWGRISLRNGPYDFKPRTRDGLGFDWPIAYEDVAPYYDKVEMLIGVYGTNEGLENTPDSPEGILLPAPEPRVGELFAKAHGRKWACPSFRIHRAVLSQRQDGEKLPAKLHPNNPKAQPILASRHAEPRRLFLGDALRSRLLDSRELSIHHRAPPAGAGDGQSGHPHQRDGARSDVDQDGKATVFFISTEKPAENDESKPGRRARSQLRRDRPHFTQFEIDAVSRRPGQLQRAVGSYIMDTVGASLRDKFRRSKICHPTTKTAPAAITSMFLGGFIKSSLLANSNSPAAITSNSAAESDAGPGPGGGLED